MGCFLFHPLLPLRGEIDHCSLIYTPSPTRPAADQNNDTPPGHACQKIVQSTLCGKIKTMRGRPAITLQLLLTGTAGCQRFACCAHPHKPSQEPMQHTICCKIWIMRGRPAITLYWFLTGTAGVPHIACCADPRHPCQRPLLSARCSSIWITSGRPQSLCIVFYKDGGVPSYCPACGGPPPLSNTNAECMLR